MTKFRQQLGLYVANKPVIVSIILMLSLYLFWMWNVLAKPEVEDAGDWPKTDFTRTTIDLSEMIEGGPGKDGIPAINQPKFDNLEHAQSWLDDREPVVVYSLEGQAKAYPLQILMYHEIVNDELAKQAIAITYCPLCNAAMVFARRYQGETLEFGVSGKVYNSNLVMYDRQTESWWLQFTGQAIVGDYARAQLELLPSQIVSFAHFRAAYPQGKVLSRITGANKKYGVNPYAHYDSRHLPVTWFYRKPFDDRLPAMQRVLGVAIDEHVHAYPLSEMQDDALIHAHVASTPILIISKKGMASAVDKPLIKYAREVLAAAAFSRYIDGEVLDFIISEGEITDKQTGSVWNMFGEAIAGKYKGRRLEQVDRGVYFAFVWLDFYPSSIIFTRQQS